MSIKDMPHVTVEQVLTLRKEAMKLEEENQALRKELETVKASIPKLKADAIREAKHSALFMHNKGIGIFGDGFDKALEQYDTHLRNYANKIEEG